MSAGIASLCLLALSCLAQPVPPPTPLPPPQPVVRQPVSLDDVLASVDRHYPLVRAAELERLVAAGQRLSAEGAFDLNLTAREIANTGTFENNRIAVGLDQPTAFLGTSVFAGWRLGAGDFPVYYGDRKTAEGGEFSAGLTLPLLRDREIDRRRAALRKAQIDQRLAEPNIQAQRIDIARAASVAYWAWVANGQQYQIAQAVRRIAERRDAQLEELVKQQKIAPIVRTDNQRLVVDRRTREVAALRALQQSAFTLSLYLRGTEGAPRVPCPEDLPPLPDVLPPLSCEQRQSDLDLALNQRPELERFRLQRAKLGIDLQLAENQQLPGLNVTVRGAQDIGATNKKDLDRAAYEAAIGLDVPLQRREARGRAQTARAQLGQVSAQEQLARDRVVTEVGDQLSALDRARELLEQARENLRLAQRLVEAEQELFQQNKSNLIFVNLRELAAAEAQVQVAATLALWHRARAEYLAALGYDPTRGAAAQADCPPAPEVGGIDVRPAAPHN